MNQSSWVPDEEGSGCSLCHCEFSLTLRRHHCRKCGALVCASCSDHFIKLAGDTAEVRVCDRCELHLHSGEGEKIEVSDQIADSLKLALKEKASELEKFNSFLLHVLEGQDVAEHERMDRAKQEIIDFCQNLESEIEKYNNLKMDSADLEKDIRLVAQRCLRAEQQTREGLSTAREIEEYSKQIGLQARMADQFRERIARLSRAPQIPPPSSPAAASSPRYQVSQLGGSVSSTASICQVLRWLLPFS